MGNSSRKHGPSCRGRSFFCALFSRFQLLQSVNICSFLRCFSLISCLASTIWSRKSNHILHKQAISTIRKTYVSRRVGSFRPFCPVQRNQIVHLRAAPAGSVPAGLSSPFSCPDCPALSLAVFSRPGHHSEEQDGPAGQTTPVSVHIRPNENRRSNHRMLLFRFLCHIAPLSLFQCTRSLFYRSTS